MRIGCLSASERVLLLLLGAAACGAPASAGRGGDAPKLDVQGEWHDPESDYARGVDYAAQPASRATENPAAPTYAITGAVILTAAGQRIDGGVLVLERGAIAHVGPAGAPIPAGATVIDAKGAFVTPGLIDTHSHIGVYAAPNVTAHQDGNEATAPVTAHVRAEHAYFPQDPAIAHALAGGVTAAQILPGSANLVGGRGLTVAMVPARTATEARFPGAPATVKMACGENPKRVYGGKSGPSTRMGEYAAFRAAFQQAAEYNAKLAAYRRNRALWLQKRERARELDDAARAAGKAGRVAVEAAPEPPARDLSLETLAGVLRGDVLAQIHCYRADEMRALVAIADEFGFAIRSFHHSLEAYKIRDVLVERQIAINTWADWYGFKMEAFDGIPENAALFEQAGGRAVIHSDSAIVIQRLNQEAAKAMWAGRHAGIDITDDQALRWITANAAWVLGIDGVTGTLEQGKRADVVIWSRHPFSVYARAEKVFVAGELAFDRERARPVTDFELGYRVKDVEGASGGGPAVGRGGGGGGGRGGGGGGAAPSSASGPAPARGGDL